MNLWKSLPAGRRGFTLIEILIVISLLGVLSTLGLSSFSAAQKRGHDSRRKEEARQLAGALRLYYTTYQQYPADAAAVPYGTVHGCGAAGSAACPCSASAQFASGVACDLVYMKRLPREMGTRVFYHQQSGGDGFQIKVSLEYTGDPDKAQSQLRCPGTGASACGTGDYCICE